MSTTIEIAREHRRNTNLRAIGWVALATALFSILMASGKFADGHVSTGQILLARYGGGFVSIMAIVAVFGRRLALRPSQRPVRHFIRALFSFGGAYALIEASARMPIVDATALSLLYVLFVIALGVLFLKERLAARHGLGVGLCLSGALLVVTSRGAFANIDAGYLGPAGLAVLGALLMAIEGILIKVLVGRDPPLVMIAYVNGFGLLLGLSLVLLEGSLPSAGSFLPFLLLGPIGVLAQFCFVRGYSMADTAIVGPVDYSWLIYAALIGAVFFGEIPSAGVIAGSLVIIGGGVVLATIRPQSAIIPLQSD